MSTTHTETELQHLPSNHPSLCPPCSDPKYISNTLTKLICTRHSTRAFLPTPVPPALLEAVLSLSQFSPSNSNTQPWRVHIVTGGALRRLSTELTHAATSGVKPATVPLPEEYRHYRSELGHQLYGPEGYNVARSDRKASLAAQLRNYRFFDAPVGAVVCMDKELDVVDAVAVGMYLQTVCLLLAERGLGTCVAVSTVAYPDVLRKELGLKEGMLPLTGLAIGYENEKNHVNKLKVRRDAWKESVWFKSE